jgi:hypothetical protein
MTQQLTIRPERSELVDALGTVGDALTRTVISVPPDLPAREALAQLYRSGAGGAPVGSTSESKGS